MIIKPVLTRIGKQHWMVRRPNGPNERGQLLLLGFVRRRSEYSQYYEAFDALHRPLSDLDEDSGLAWHPLSRESAVTLVVGGF